MTRTAAPARRPRAGLTLTETLVAMSISLVAVGTAVPGFDGARERRHLEGVTAQLETDLQLARSEAVALNRTLRIAFERGVAGGCYVIHTGGAQDCRCGDTGPVCQGDAVALRSARLDAESGVSLAGNVQSMVFDPAKGTVTPTGTLRVVGRSGREIRTVVNIMGRVRSCSPAGGVSGLPAC